jgi:WD40 repeat protein
METKPDQLVLSPDGRLLMTAHGQTVRIRDLETGRELRRYTIDAQEARRLAFSPDSAYAAAGSFRGWVYLWRLSDAELPGSPKGTFSLPTKAADGGDWSLTLDGKSKYTFQRNGAVAVEGTYKIAGDQIELTDESGPNRELGDKRTGTYRWKLAGASLLFTPVKDEGRGRMGVLVSGAWIALKKP